MPTFVDAAEGMLSGIVVTVSASALLAERRANERERRKGIDLLYIECRFIFSIEYMGGKRADRDGKARHQLQN